MRFTTVDELLGRQLAGETGTPSARHLGLRLTAFARGVAVYELPVGEHLCGVAGRVDSGVLAALAEEAMHAAAMSVLSDEEDPADGLVMRDLRARFDRQVSFGDCQGLRAEAIVVRAGATVRVQADVLCGDHRVASFECECDRPGIERLQHSVAAVA